MQLCYWKVFLRLIDSDFPDCRRERAPDSEIGELGQHPLVIHFQKLRNQHVRDTLGDLEFCGYNSLIVSSTSMASSRFIPAPPLSTYRTVIYFFHASNWSSCSFSCAPSWLVPPLSGYGLPLAATVSRCLHNS